MTNAHHAITDFADAHNLKDSPRTTCVACIVQDNIAYWAHAGDSRLYLMRDGRVLLHTRDHSRVQLLKDQGVINEAQAAVHPDRNKVYSCLGGRKTPEIEFSRKTPLEAGDVLALCTDGVWGVIPGEMLAVALKTDNLMQAVPMLLGQADIRGGPNADNLSIVAVRWEDSYREEGSSPSSVVLDAIDVARHRHHQTRRLRPQPELQDRALRGRDRTRDRRNPFNHSEVLQIGIFMRPSQRKTVTNAPRAHHPQLHPATPRVRCSSKWATRKYCALPALKNRCRPSCAAKVRAGSPPNTACCRARRTRAARAEAAKGKQSGRTQEIQRPDRPLAARRDRPQGARRTPDHARLRRAAGRRRHALRVDHRCLAGAARRLRLPRRPRTSLRRAHCSITSRRFRSASTKANWCSTSITPRIPTAIPT